MTGDNPFADEDDDLDKTVVRPAMASQPAPPATGPAAPAPAPQAPLRATHPAPATDAPPARPTARFSVQNPAPRASAAPPASPPRPVGQGALSAPGAAPLGDPALIRDPRLLNGASISRLMDAAAPMLALIVTARDLESHPDPEALLDGAITEIRAFETAALAAGYSNEQIRLSRYALCATMDDVVLATPWGGQTAWANRGLVSTIHRETMSGERFYALLDQLMPKSGDHLDELQVFYVCLSLGFEGKYRILPRGASELSRVRDRLHRVLARDVEPVTAPLSPAGLGEAPVGGRFPGGVTPVWLPVVLAAVVMAGLYLLQARDLSAARQSVAAIEARFAQPIQRADVALPPPAAAPPPPAPVQAPPEPTLGDRLRQILAQDIAARRIEVLDLPQGAAVRIIAPDIFPSGGSTLARNVSALVQRIGTALEREEGVIGVIGHTDSIPMRANARFADNTELSLARAQAVADVVRAVQSHPSRVQVRGLGPTMPIADNATPEGRAVNRRVEIVLLDQDVSVDQGLLSLGASGAWGGER